MALTQTPLEKGFEKLYTPFQKFIHDQTTSSIILILCFIAALVISNSPLLQSYESFTKISAGFIFGDRSFHMDLKHWVNEGLMTYFFFLIGMEIKREILVGDIRTTQQLTPILAAAIGGMLLPASIYYLFNLSNEFSHGWGVPMATDTALSLGILALIGKRIPAVTAIFFTLFAIIDDLGAILVIAFFYSESINTANIIISIMLLMTLVLCNLFGIRKPSIYFFGGVVIWAVMLDSGIHATISGILVAATIPARSKHEPSWFIHRVHRLLRRYEHIEYEKDNNTPVLGEPEQHDVVESVKEAAEKATTPLKRWENVLEQPVALFILPLFAFFNAGVPVSSDLLVGAVTEPFALGILFGLVIGKGVGIPLFCWIAVQLKLGQLPAGMNMQHVIGVGLLGGVGFTMSIFISGLEFENNLQALLTSKMAIMLASCIAGLGGYLWLRFQSSSKISDVAK